MGKSSTRNMLHTYLLQVVTPSLSVSPLPLSKTLQTAKTVAPFLFANNLQYIVW